MKSRNISSTLVIIISRLSYPYF